jgi:steroid delta-isomerase-like uncharacterized protein
MASIMDMIHAHNMAWNSHDASKVASFYTEDCLLENVATGEVAKGREAVRLSTEASFANNPDVKVEAKNVFASENWSASELVLSGINADKQFSVRACRVAEYEGNLIKRTAVYYDMATVMKQMGR